MRYWLSATKTTDWNYHNIVGKLLAFKSFGF
jgi:hypothetical protein